jgi:hypothetical protein
MPTLITMSEKPNGDVWVWITAEEGPRTVNLTTQLSCDGNMHDLLSRHAGLYAFWAAVRARLEAEKDQEEAALDRVSGEISELLRLETKAEGIAATAADKVVKNRLEQSPRYQEAVEAANSAKSRARIGLYIVQAFEHRRDTLIQLAISERRESDNESAVAKGRAIGMRG